MDLVYFLPCSVSFLCFKYLSHLTRLSISLLPLPQECVESLRKFMDMIETTVDLDQAKQGQYVIKPDFDEELSGELGAWFRVYWWWKRGA